MATYREVETRLRELLDFPDWERPNRQQRITYVNTAIDTFSKLVNFLGKPQLIDHFDLSVPGAAADPPTPGEFSVPRDDAEDIFYAYSLNDGHTIKTANFADMRTLGVWPSGSFSGQPGTVSHIAVIGQGDNRKIMTFPPGADDTIRIYYNRAPAIAEKGLDDEVDLLDQFHMVLIPAAAALVGMPHWHWAGLAAEEQAAKKAAMMDTGNAFSLVGIVAQQTKFFEERAFNPNVVHPSKRLQGHGHRRRLQRRIRS